MLKRGDLQDLVLKALKKLEGRGTVLQVAKEIWVANEAELRASGDIFYTWQYDARWAATRPREQGKIAMADQSPRGVWELVQP
jgi:hypothetical protein